MPNLNRVLLMGNLTRDPELKATPKGTPVCQFSLAINRQWKTESGEKQEEVTYVDVEAWGKQAETIAKYVLKGKPLYVEGRLKLEQWEDKETKAKRSRMKVVLEQFQFLDSKSDEAGAGPTTEPQRNETPIRAAASKPAAQQSQAEDIPY